MASVRRLSGLNRSLHPVEHCSCVTVDVSLSMTDCQARTAGQSPTSWLCPSALRRFVRLPDPILDRIQRRKHARASTVYYSLSVRCGPSRPRHIQAGPGIWRDSRRPHLRRQACARQVLQDDLAAHPGQSPHLLAHGHIQGRPSDLHHAPLGRGRHRCGARQRCHTAGAPLSHCANKRARPSGQPKPCCLLSVRVFFLANAQNCVAQVIV